MSCELDRDECIAVQRSPLGAEPCADPEHVPGWAEGLTGPEPHEAAQARKAFDKTTAELAEQMAEVPPAESLTDAVIVQRLYDEMLHDRFCWAVGFGWLKWTGRLWAEVSEETVREAVRVWSVDTIKPLLANPFLGNSRDIRQRVMALLSTYTLKALTELSRGLCQVDPDVFDGEPDWLNVQNGIVNLRDGQLLTHDPSHYMTRIAAVDYRPGAEHEDWPAALAAVPDEVADWLQVRFGQAITGHMAPDHVLLLLCGGGSNGKSTMLAGISDSLGKYATYVSDRVLLAESGAHPTELTEFRGARFALTEELPDNGKLNAKRLKDIIGTPTMTARKIRQDSITWQSTHSMFLSTNHLPKVTETDEGTWRRLVLVDFPYKFVSPEKATGAPHERPGDSGLPGRLKGGSAQREAVLAWLVAGARRWYEGGKVMPPVPSVVERSTRQWREQSDLIVRFWNECLVASADNFIASTDMLEVFNGWATSQGHTARSLQRLMSEFGEHDVTRSAGVVYQQRRVRPGEVQSFRPAPELTMMLPHGSTAVRSQPEPGAKVRAWWGVRFSDQDE